MLSEKSCSKCKIILPASEFYPHRRMRSGLQSQCRKCSREWHRERPDYIREKNNDFKKRNPTYHLNWQRKNNYGLSSDDAVLLRQAQGEVCHGCLSSLSDVKECVDHCHKTGRVRGFLCNDCNVSIGRLKDDEMTLRRLADYLEKAKAEAEAYLI